MRQRLAQTAARIMVEEAVKDFHLAKRKAAERLGAPDTRNMPGNREIQDAVHDYQRLFMGRSQVDHLRELRKAAVEAMEYFGRFRPKLVGSVLDGTAGEHSDVNLHLFADTVEDVSIFLMDHDIPFEMGERRFNFGRNGYLSFPTYRFFAGAVAVDLTVFSADGLREAPRSRVDGTPMRRANVGSVRALLEGSESAPPGDV